MVGAEIYATVDNDSMGCAAYLVAGSVISPADVARAVAVVSISRLRGILQMSMVLPDETLSTHVPVRLGGGSSIQGTRDMEPTLDCRGGRRGARLLRPPQLRRGHNRRRRPVQLLEH